MTHHYFATLSDYIAHLSALSDAFWTMDAYLVATGICTTAELIDAGRP